MSTVNHHRVVVRRKAARGRGKRAGGSWKIAYADFITAMMAFFLVLWLLSTVPHEELKGIADYFRTPLRVAIEGGAQSASQQSIPPGGGQDPLRDDGDVRRAEGVRLQAQADAERRDARGLQALKQRLENLIETNPILKNFRPQLLIDMTTEGLRIQIVDNKNRPMFATGRADVQSYMRDILRELGPALNDIPNLVSISGHTDAAQYARGEKAYSNWELSADRANASRQELVAGGMHEGKIARIQGLAASMSLVKDDPYAAVNRRISLVVLNQRTQRRIEAENAAAADATPGGDSDGGSSALETVQSLTQQPQTQSPSPSPQVPSGRNK
jgi:chemotaxis protein MotB